MTPAIDVQDLIERVTANNEESGLETHVFEPRSWDSAIIGYIADGDRHRLVYDEELLLQAIEKSMPCNRAEAIEWYEYNTLRTLPYMEDAKHVAPMVVMK